MNLATGYRLWVPRWALVSSLVFSVAGLGVATYLTIAHFTSAAILACSGNGTVNCEKVTTSPQSEIFGHIPVAVLGLGFFVVMLGLSLPRVWQSGIYRLDQARLAFTVVGVGMVVYLIYAELYQIHAICLYCTAVHALTFLLFVVALAAYQSSEYYEPEAAPVPGFRAVDDRPAEERDVTAGTTRIRDAERASWQASMGRVSGARAPSRPPARSAGRLVARAARTGGGRASYRRNTPWNWWASMGIIVVLGIALVTYSRYERLHPAAAATNNNNSTPPTLSDHWFEAYSFDVCNTVEPPLQAPSSLAGITTKGDGLIHVAPLSAADTGKNATLGRFLSNYSNIKLSETSLTYNGKTYDSASTNCGSQPGLVEVEVWDSPTASSGHLVTGDPTSLKLANGQLIAIAFLPHGTTIPKPETSALVRAMSSASTPTTTGAGATTSTTGGATTSTTR